MNDRKFEVHCNAMPNGHLQVRAQALSVGVGQMIGQDPIKEMWQSVLVVWEQNLQIACIRSRSPEPGKPDSALEIDLKSAHV